MSKHNTMKILYRMRYSLFSALLVLLAANSVAGQIQLSFTTTSPTCSGYTDGTATVTATGGSEPYAYLWDNNQTGQTNFGLGAGTVFVTVTDQSGQTATGSVTLTQPAYLAVNITADGLSCISNEGSLTANVSGGTAPYSYNWNTNDTTQTIQITLPGTYFVTVTDANACSQVGTYNVALAAEFFPVFNYHPPLCAGQPTGSIDVLVYGTNPPFTWKWENGVENQSLINVPSGEYDITITDATGCTYTDTAILEDLAQLTVDVTATDIPCSYLPNGGAVSAFVTGGTQPYTYVWSNNGSNDPGQLGLPAGVYTVTVYDKFGCTATDTDTIDIPPALTGIIVSLSPACNGNGGCITVQGVGGTPPYTYVWPALGITGPTACGLAPGEYYVCIFDANKCQHDIIVTMYAIDSLNVDLQLTNAQCLGIDNGSVIATVDPPTGVYNYQWEPQPQPNSPQIDSLAAGTIVSVTVTDANTGCMGTAVDTLGAIVEIDLNINQTDNTCLGDTIGNATANASGGTAPYGYVWTFPDSSTVNGPTISDLPVGTYFVTATDASGCFGVDSAVIKVVASPINLAVQDDNIITCDTLVPLTASVTASGVTFVWVNSQGDTVGTTSTIEVIVPDSESFVVTATDPFGCSDTASVTVSSNSVNISPSFGPDTLACANVPMTFSVTNNDPNDTLTYDWSATDPNVVITPIGASTVTVVSPSAGGYTISVLVKNQFDCSQTLSSTVNVQPSISLEGFLKVDLCKGKEVDFFNTSPVTGIWDFGDGNTSNELNPTHTYAQEGNYIVTFTSTSACAIPFDTTITVLPEAAVQAGIFSDYVSCTNQARIQFTDSTTATYPLQSWNWSFSTTPPQTSTQQNPLITFVAEGTITATLTVTDVNGCADTISMPLDVKVVSDSLDNEGLFCPGDSIALNPDFNPNYDYGWVSLPNDPDFDASNPNPYVQPGVPTMYIATIQNGECAVIDSIEITPKPAATVELPGDTLLCSYDLYVIQAQNSNGVAFTWSESPDFTPSLPSTGDSVIISPKKNGVYYVRALNADGCAAIDSVKINNAAVEIDAEPANRSICLGDSTELTVTNLDPEDILTYEWTPLLDPIPNPVVMPNTTTTYTVKSTNQFGCADTMQFNVKVISIEVTAEVMGKDTVCPGESTELLATVISNANDISYDWTPSNSLDDPNIPDPEASPSETTIYTVTAVAEDLCPDTASVIVYFMTTECKEPYIFVPKAFTPNNDGNNDLFIVRGVDIKEVYFVVWNRWGEKVYETRDPQAQGWDGTFNGKELTPDSYAWYLEVTCGNGEIFTNKGDVTLLK